MLPSLNLTGKKLKKVFYSSRKNKEHIGEGVKATFNSDRKGGLEHRPLGHGLKLSSVA